MELNNSLTDEERKSVVLNTWETEWRCDGKRFFIFDCNNGVLNKDFNEKLRHFLQDAIKNYHPTSKYSKEFTNA